MENQTTEKASRDIRDTKYFTVSSAVIRIILGTLFVVSGIGKLFDLYHFELLVASFHILPLAVVPAFSYALPFVEMLVGLPMLVGFKTKRTAIGMMFLLVMFIAAMAINNYNLLVGNCACDIDGINVARGWQIIVLDVILLLLCVQVFFTKKHAWSVDGKLKKNSK
jgi:uncharacterized membrane protein YphA (DoxX/SURF4 family)